jgi:hypothetical protein
VYGRGPGPGNARGEAGGSSHAFAQMISAPLPRAEHSKLEENLSSACHSLSEAEAQSGCAEGIVISAENATQYSLQDL